MEDQGFLEEERFGEEISRAVGEKEPRERSPLRRVLGGPARAAGRDRGPRIFPAEGQKNWSTPEDPVSQRSEQLPTRRAVRRSRRLRPRSGTRKKTGPRPARGMVCPNAAAVMRKDCGIG